jgi:Isopropylmalate/homocitrate/citramalate synthases
MSEVLKPCPFCGAPARLWGDGERVECSARPSCCWGWFEDTVTKAGPVKSWNYRTPGGEAVTNAEFVELVAEMRAAQKQYFDPKTRTQDTLAESKLLERKVDKAIDEVRAGAKQGELFP